MTTTKIKIPIWFWIVSIIALLWNLMGLGAFFAHLTMTPEALATLSPEQKGLYNNQPIWVNIVFGGAVILGVLGCIGLLLRQRWCKPLLLLSLASALAQMAYNFSQDAYNIMGAGSLPMGLVIIGFAVFLVWFARFADSRGYTT